MIRIHFLSLLAALGVTVANANAGIKDGLIFHSGFDEGLSADLAKGEKNLYWAPSIKFPPEAKPGLPPGNVVTLAKGEGKFGDCLHFTKKANEMVFYYAKGNFPYATSNMNGTVSFWLRLTPDEDLAPGYTDPIQITSKGWDNAAFFIEFTKDEKPRELRLGAYADFEVWNPDKRDWNKIPFEEKPLIKVVNPPFRRDQWTHVAFTFGNYNSGKPNGETRLYLNGILQGALKPRVQTFTWDQEKALIMLGLSYVGHWDELAIYNRVLNEKEIQALSKLDKPLNQVK